MKKLSFAIVKIIFITAIVYCPSGAFAFSDQTTTERILKENRYFVNFINISVTNFADDKKEELKNAYEKHFNGEIAYLQSDYRRAFKRIYASQGDMVKLYEDVLRDHYLEAAKFILDSLAPGIIMSKNARARLYLTLGYRDRTVSWTHYTVGEASNPKLHSYKLFKYEEAIKMARRAKRYGFLALFESQTDEIKIQIYNDLMIKENEKEKGFFSRFIGLDEKGIIDELGKSYDDYEKELNENKQNQTEKEQRTFDNKVARRVRFRHEVRVARYLLNHEFDQAEDIMRKYIEDFNYKLALSTFDVLISRQSNVKEETAQAPQSRNINYEQYKIHLMDNYQRLARDSFLNVLIDEVKVEDEVKEKEDVPPLIETLGERTGNKPAGDTDKEQETRKDRESNANQSDQK
ncbi:MAG TPA: hypothetical protein PK926_05220 [Spirochaetota bacterium]|nr:hypothetical protein [Spirochaetota bacterium]HPI88136.1 hypothetical protein [Spirochaetota bacterium]HPR47911.1 hypothetical protein [Spirochaetota bacterium]